MEYLYNLLFYFMIYSFAGWCGEVIFATVRHGKFVNRGMLHGAYCPIYGFGLIIVIVCLPPIKDSWLLLFVGSAVLTTVLEFVTGFVLDKIFGRRWWDYSNKKLNIGGYICPQFTIVWGLASLAIMKVIQPAVAFAVGLIWKPLGIVILCLFYAAILTDVILTFPDAIGSGLSDKTSQAVEFSKEHGITPDEMQKKADELKARLETASYSVKQRNSERISELKGSAAERREELTARFNELNERLSELKAKHKRLYKAFPSLKEGRAKLKKAVQNRKR